MPTERPGDQHDNPTPEQARHGKENKDEQEDQDDRSAHSTKQLLQNSFGTPHRRIW